MKPHKHLKVWQLGMDLVVDIYKHTRRFSETEKFGLISQMRRCAVSIPSNIAEGASRNSQKEFINFLYISLGSLSELDTQVEVSHRVNYLNDDDTKFIMMKMDEVGRLLSGLIRSIKNSEQKKSK